MNYRNCRIALFGVVLAVGIFSGHAQAQETPIFGTFYSMQMTNQPPLPFNPFPELPLYELGQGIYAYDDREVDYAAWRQQQAQSQQPSAGAQNKSGVMLAGGSGSGAQTMSGPSPPGCCGGGGGGGFIACDGPTNFVVTYTYSSSNLWLDITRAANNVATLRIHTSTTNAAYDVFGTTNLNQLALPVLSQTNWAWLVRAEGSSTSFLWNNLVPCAAFFELGTMLDEDADGLTTAYEGLVSHTLAGNADSDGDGLADGAEVLQGRDPLAGWVTDTSGTVGLEMTVWRR